jgi:hypothetical protein
MFKLIFVFILLTTTSRLAQNITNETNDWSTIDNVQFNYSTNNELLNLSTDEIILESSDTNAFLNTTPLDLETETETEMQTEIPTTMNPFEETTKEELSTTLPTKIKYAYFIIELLIQEDLKSQLYSKTPKQIYFELINRVQIYVQNALDSNGLFGFEEFTVFQMFRRGQNQLELTSYLTYRITPTMNAKYRLVNALSIKKALKLGDSTLANIVRNNIRVYKTKPSNILL